MGVLAVVIIGRNEERRLRYCIRSVLAGIRPIPETQVVYVDSASQDQSVTIARQFPITVLQIPEDRFLSAAAGRTIGYVHSKSLYLFFIDGDSMVYHGWLWSAISFLDAYPDIGGVAGLVHELWFDREGRVVGMKRNRYEQRHPIEEVQTLGGIALYRRSVLEGAKPFNPFITVDEERELALRIRRCGYRLVRILEPMAITSGPQRETFHELFRRSRSGLYDFGRTLRYCQVEGFFFLYLKERLTFVTSTLAVVIGLGILIGMVLMRGGGRGALYFSGALFLGVSLLALRWKRSLLIRIVKRLLMLVRTLWSYLATRPIPPHTYPITVRVIQIRNP